MRVILLLAVCMVLESSASPRQIFDTHSPNWMRAVGKLDVPGQKWENSETFHVAEHCTATLITGRPGADARHILSAWHCLEYYRDVSKTIKFNLPALGLSRTARPVATGGGMHADWALLKLNQPISYRQVSALHTGAEGQKPPGTEITMAGFSADLQLGENGDVLSYDQDCRILATTSRMVTTDCLARKGASGGPVVVQSGGRYQLLGVISAGDSNSRSMYVPTASFAWALRLNLAPRP